MKDQRVLLKKCLENKIPAIVLKGTDRCALKIMQSAGDIYKKNGCSMEFLYDFENLVKNFKGFHAEYKNELVMPSLYETPNVKALNKCIYEDIPVIVFQGTDNCASEILKSAKSIYQEDGYSEKFLAGFDSFIKDFEEYSQFNANSIKLAGLSETEKDFVREDMDYDFENAVKNGNISHLTQMKELGYHFPDNQIENHIQQYPKLLQFIDNPSDDIIIAAVRKDPLVIEYVDNPSERVQFAAVHGSPYAIQAMRNPTDKVLIRTINDHPSVFELIDRPSENVQLAAVRIDPSNLQFISEPSKDVVIAAMILDPHVYRLCDNISGTMYDEIVKPYLAFHESVEKKDYSALVGLKEQGYQPPMEVVRTLSASFSESTSVAVQKIFGVEIVNPQLTLNLVDNSELSQHLSNAVEQSI